MINSTEELKALLESAYREGWYTGYWAGVSDGHPLGSYKGSCNNDWRLSDIKEMLDKDVT